MEFLYDIARRSYYFLEVNTRLQVEHAVTEMVTGLDLIELILRIGAGETLDWPVLERPPRGAAMEVRLYADNPARNFQPSPGTLTDVYFPPRVRVDGWVDTGTEVTGHYDPMLAKMIVQWTRPRCRPIESCIRSSRYAPARHRDEPRIPARHRQ